MNTVIQANLERCLRSPYLRRDELKRQEIGAELAAAQDLYNQAKTSFEAEDTTTGMKQAWGAMFRAARALVYAAGYAWTRAWKRLILKRSVRLKSCMGLPRKRWHVPVPSSKR